MELPSFLTRTQFGEIVLTGHRVGLYSVVRSFQEGSSAEQIAEEFPTLPLILVEQVIAFYGNHPSEVDAYVTACREEIARQMAEFSGGPDRAELQRRWRVKGMA